MSSCSWSNGALPVNIRECQKSPNTSTTRVTRVRPGTSARIESLADFLEAVGDGKDLWNGGTTHSVSWQTENGSGEYEALKALGWSACADYGSYGMEWMYVYSPHPK